ncbi:hypothetical protein HFN59_02355 [Rhizobium leguminosarum]|uniref:hypothetical protein n=1 Tax=Rhizobium leguminosarum TaxID=384 RepID=UPI001C969E90|nr:hypothetical protein [Rhizobium leguminosarum]MBY5775966.1 hypothetical protein [Rhizobium leguminosarum]
MNELGDRLQVRMAVLISSGNLDQVLSDIALRHPRRSSDGSAEHVIRLFGTSTFLSTTFSTTISFGFDWHLDTTIAIAADEPQCASLPRYDAVSSFWIMAGRFGPDLLASNAHFRLNSLPLSDS